MAKPLTSWLVPSFLQHNLRLVVSGRWLHVSVTKFQDKFASLRKVISPYSWNKFQICCTDLYLIRFLPKFAVFFVFLWISRDFAAPRPREISEALGKGERLWYERSRFNPRLRSSFFLIETLSITGHFFFIVKMAATATERKFASRCFEQRLTQG